MGNFNNIPHVNQRRFLNAFAKCGQIGKASEQVGIDRTNHYKWLKADTEYVTAFAEAQQMAGDLLEDEAVRRAQDGIDKAIFHKGRQVATVKEYSDSLMIFLLKGNKPDKFKDRQDITSAGKELRITLANSGDAI